MGLFCGKCSFGCVAPPEFILLVGMSDFPVCEFLVNVRVQFSLPIYLLESRRFPCLEVMLWRLLPELVNLCNVLLFHVRLPQRFVKQIFQLRELLPRVVPESGCLAWVNFPEVVFLYEFSLSFCIIPDGWSLHCGVDSYEITPLASFGIFCLP